MSLGNSDIQIVWLDITSLCIPGTWWQQIPWLTDTQFNDGARKPETQSTDSGILEPGSVLTSVHGGSRTLGTTDLVAAVTPLAVQFGTLVTAGNAGATILGTSAFTSILIRWLPSIIVLTKLSWHLRVSGPPRMEPKYSKYLATSSRAHYTFNLLKPTGYVMRQLLYIQQLYALPTLYLCALYLSENKQRLVPLTA